MISWIKGELVCSWINNKKSYVIINCSGLGYEIQTVNLVVDQTISNEIVLWLVHLKREDNDLLFGFIKKEDRDFFRILISIKGIGPQIGMSILASYSFNDVINALSNENRDMFNSIPGIGKKMTERIFFELQNKFKDYKLQGNQENNKANEISMEIETILSDLSSALNSLDYSKKDILNTINFLKENIKLKNKNESNININYTFEELFKDAICHLDEK